MILGQINIFRNTVGTGILGIFWEIWAPYENTSGYAKLTIYGVIIDILIGSLEERLVHIRRMFCSLKFGPFRSDIRFTFDPFDC